MQCILFSFYILIKKKILWKDTPHPDPEIISRFSADVVELHMNKRLKNILLGWPCKKHDCRLVLWAFPRRFMFFQSRFSALSLVSLCKKSLCTCKKWRAGAADTAKGYSVYLNSACLAPPAFLSHNVNATEGATCSKQENRETEKNLERQRIIRKSEKYNYQSNRLTCPAHPFDEKYPDFEGPKHLERAFSF